MNSLCPDCQNRPSEVLLGKCVVCFADEVAISIGFEYIQSRYGTFKAMAALPVLESAVRNGGWKEEYRLEYEARLTMIIPPRKRLL